MSWPLPAAPAPRRGPAIRRRSDARKAFRFAAGWGLCLWHVADHDTVTRGGAEDRASADRRKTGGLRATPADREFLCLGGQDPERSGGAAVDQDAQRSVRQGNRPRQADTFL